jgi:Tfp pilus assembly protein PilN
MINLLPKIQFEELEREKRMKMVLIFGIVSLASLLALNLILFSVKILSQGKLESQSIIFQEKEKELGMERIKEKEKEIKNYNLLFSNLLDFYQKQRNVVEILEKINSLLPENSYLKSFKFKLSSEKGFFGDVSLTGFSPDRESLVKIKRNFEKEDIFSDVFIPSSSWVPDYNVEFSLSFRIKK